MATLPYVPRSSTVLRDKALIARDWDLWFQTLANTLDALSTTILSGPDANPNGVVVASPGAIYTRRGASTSQLFIKESGIDTNTGWVGK